MAHDARQLVLLLVLFTDVVMSDTLTNVKVIIFCSSGLPINVTRECLTECSVGCTSCSGTTCLECESSYFLSDGFCSPCPEQCTSCNGYNNCMSCKPGKWGLDNQCQFPCVDSCYNKECQYDTGFCDRCKPGLYGLQCQLNCSFCKDDLCDLIRCTHGCKQGYYEYKTEQISICQRCTSDCRYCNDASTCQICNGGFHLYQFNSNGKHFVRCVGCSLGSNCSNYCVIQNCKHCKNQDGALVCTDCPDGYKFNGSICIPKTNSCSLECSSSCDDYGICLGSCIAGWTGEKCSVKCSDKCLTCDKSNRNICQQCKGDFYTIGCTAACNTKCLTEEGKQTCRFNDGYCLNGCEYNFWRHVCDQRCSNGCLDAGSSPCERSNGSCKYGCKDGYSGNKCNIGFARKSTAMYEATTSRPNPTSTQYVPVCEENDRYRNNFIEGFFTGLGTSVAVAVITVTLFYLRRRHISKKLKSQQDLNKTIEMPTYYNADAGHTIETQEAANETNNYERLGNTKNTDNVYNDLEATTVQ